MGPTTLVWERRGDDWLIVYADADHYPVPRPRSAGSQPSTGGAMEKVTGIGGLFFRASDPEALSRWYERHLGVALVPDNYEDSPWFQRAGPTVFAPFPETTDYFGDPGQAWMVNFRVSDLDAMVAQLRDAGVEVTVDSQEYPNGRFARAHDPEGNPIELWEPAGPHVEPEE
jgi:predicted enzyme related to lactoylglutathione lyase